MNYSNQIIKNLFSLTSAEIISKIISVFTTAYLARILLPEGYGILGFATAFVSYFALFANFGFDIYGTREIAKDETKITYFVNQIFSIKIILSIIGYLVLFIVTILVKQNYLTKMVILVVGVNLFVNVFTLDWVFLGVEKMWLVGIKKVLTNLLTLIGLLIFVKSQNNIVLAAVILISSSLINSAWLVGVYEKLNSKIKLKLDFKNWKLLLKESFPLVASSFMIAIYYNLDMVMLGYMKSNADVGIYNAAYKILLVGIIPFGLILNSFFPSLSKIGLERSSEFEKVFSQYSILMLSVGVLITLVVFFNAGEIIKIIFGNDFSNAKGPLLILSLNIMVICVNIIFGNPLIAWGKQKQYSYAIALGAVTNIILNILLIPGYSYFGAAFATLISEVAVFVGVFTLFNKYTYRMLTT